MESVNKCNLLIRTNDVHDCYPDAQIKNPSLSFGEIPGLPKKAVSVLEQNFVPLTSSISKCTTSTDGKTTKLLIKLQDDNLIEAGVFLMLSSSQ